MEHIEHLEINSQNGNTIGKFQTMDVTTFQKMERGKVPKNGK